MSTEGGSNFSDHCNGRVATAAFYPPKVGHINLGVMGKLLLGKAALTPQPPHVITNDLIPIHWRA